MSPKANLILTPRREHRRLPELRQRLSLERRARQRSSAVQRHAEPGTGVDVVEPRRSRRRSATSSARARASSTGSTSPPRSGTSTSRASWSSRGDAGTIEPRELRRAARWGIDFEARYQINGWLYADYDLSWVHAALRRRRRRPARAHRS